MTDIAIRVSDLSKCYQIYDTPRDRLKQFILPRLQRQVGRQPEQYYREFWALKNVSFEIKRGETVGIIGRNGSGKSTLLQMICGTLTPTNGTVQTYGRVAALLELGSGFNPDFTGRENVYMNATVLGLSKEEIDGRFEDIAAFADIGQFIEQPVKTYSSGMVVRLAFAVAISVDPEILVVDEALAVGDYAFQQKCFRRISDIQDSGCSILLVTHDLSSIVQFCRRGIILSHGETLAEGPSKEIVGRFKQYLSIDEKCKAVTQAEGKDNVIPHFPIGHMQQYFERNPNGFEYGDSDARIIDWGVIDSNGKPVSIINGNESVDIVIAVRFLKCCRDPIIGYFLSDLQGREIVGTNTMFEETVIGKKSDNEIVVVKFKQPLQVAAGIYSLNLGCSEYIEDRLVVHHRLYDISFINVYTNKRFVGFCSLQTAVTVLELEEGNLD